MPQPASERRHVFISYSHADRAWVERLKRMMAPLLRGSGQELRLWDDSRIEAGMKWREEIETALAEAKVALLLVSDAFLASEFVMGQEVPKLLAAAEADGVPVLWVSLSPSFVDETEIHSYQAVLPPHRHPEAMAEVEWKEALRTVGLAIRKALQQPLAAVSPSPSICPKPSGPPIWPATPCPPKPSSWKQPACGAMAWLAAGAAIAAVGTGAGEAGRGQPPAVADYWLEKQRRMIDQLNVCLGMQRLSSAKGLDVSPDEVIPCQVKPSGSMPAWPELPSPMQSENPSMQV